MPSAELEAVVAQLRAHPLNLSGSEQQLRIRLDGFAKMFSVPPGVEVATTRLGGIAAEHVVADASGPVVLYLHGGGYVTGSPSSHRHVAALIAKEASAQAYTLDYSLAPEAPFPAALDDVLAAYRALLVKHGDGNIIFAGDSAGGGLIFAAAIAARAQGLPSPAALVGMSPWVNLGTESESFDNLVSVDPTLSREVVAYFSSRYLAGQSPTDPRASPLFADVTGLPPVLIQVGDRECFFGDAVRMHQTLVSAGVDSELSVWKGMFHVWHLYWPILSEGREAIARIAGFIAAHGRVQTVLVEKEEQWADCSLAKS
jgi:epsilon-lactone hydrolase